MKEAISALVVNRIHSSLADIAMEYRVMTTLLRGCIKTSRYSSNVCAVFLRLLKFRAYDEPCKEVTIGQTRLSEIHKVGTSSVPTRLSTVSLTYPTVLTATVKTIKGLLNLRTRLIVLR